MYTTKVFLCFRRRHLLKRRVHVRYCTSWALARLNIPVVKTSKRKLQRRNQSTNDQSTLVYTGPLGKTVRLLKLFSVTTAALTVSFTPILILFGNPASPLSLRIGISTVVLSVGVSTTLLLHWFMKGYITRLYCDNKNLSAITYDLIGREKLTQFHLSEAKPPDRVATLSTFQAKGQTYFIHTDIFEDVDLLQRLAGPLPVFSETFDRK